MSHKDRLLTKGCKEWFTIQNKERGEQRVRVMKQLGTFNTLIAKHGETGKAKTWNGKCCGPCLTDAGETSKWFSIVV